MTTQNLESTNTNSMDAKDIVKSNSSILSYFYELKDKGLVEEVSNMHKPEEFLFYFKRSGETGEKKNIRVSEIDGNFTDFSKKKENGKFLFGDIFLAAMEFEKMLFPAAIQKFEAGLSDEVKEKVDIAKSEFKNFTEVEILNATEQLTDSPNEKIAKFLKRINLDVTYIKPFVNELDIKFFHPEEKKIIEGTALGFKTNEGCVMSVVSNDKKLYLSTTKEVSMSTIDVGDSTKEAKIFANFVDFFAYKNLFPDQEYKAAILHAGIYNAPFDLEKATDQIEKLHEEMSKTAGQEIIVTHHLPDNKKSEEITKSINERFAKIFKPSLNAGDDFYKKIGFNSVSQYSAQRSKMVKNLQFISTKEKDPNILILLAQIIKNTFSERDWLTAKNIYEDFTNKNYKTQDQFKDLNKDQSVTQDLSQEQSPMLQIQ